jgi:hypothetical protein
MVSVDEIADRLYALPPEEFTQAAGLRDAQFAGKGNIAAAVG